MQPPDDSALLRQYAENNSDEAFAALVTRHINLVYSVALRQVGNPHAAEEITQAVFIILAKKAAQLRHDKALASWLFQTTRLTANNFIRSESRRHRREEEAFMQSVFDQAGTEIWPRIAPLLDTAVAGLREKDRQAIVLRFYEGRNLREVGLALGASEDAAEKRVNRALEILRKFFAKRGVVSTAAMIAAAISVNPVQAAPVGLAKTISAVASAKGAAASVSTLTLIKGALKIMAWTKAKTAIVVGAATILTIGTAVFIAGEIAAPGGSDAERGPVAMQIKWQAGKKYVLHRETTQTTETKQPNQPKPLKQVAKTTQDFNLSPVNLLDNGGRQLQLEFESLTVEVSNGSRQTVSADSAPNPAPDADNPVGARLRRMVGARLQYFINANGKVEKMEGYQELEKRVAGENPQEQAAFKNLFNENTLKLFGSIGEDMTPRRVVKLGNSWATRLEVPTDIGMLNLDAKFNFKNWEQRADHKCMHIKFTGDYSLQAATNAPNPPVKFEKTGLSGEYWLDPELGMVVEMTFDADVTLKINQREQVLATRSDQKTRYVLLAVEDVAK